MLLYGISEAALEHCRELPLLQQTGKMWSCGDGGSCREQETAQGRLRRGVGLILGVYLWQIVSSICEYSMEWDMFGIMKGFKI